MIRTLLPPLALAGLVVLAAFASPADAQHRAPGRAEVIQKLAACGSAADDAAQLACYRQATAAILKAEADGEIVIVDRQDAREVRREAFGLSLPSLSLFDRGESEEALSTFVGQVRAARQDPAGRWVVQLDSGATWTQVETLPLRSTPKPGMPVTISKAALGSYKMKIGDQHAVRARRVE